MQTSMLLGLLLTRAAWRRRDRWTAGQIAGHQQAELQRLRSFAYRRSPFYRRHHAGLLTAPLSELPPVTKTDLMEHFGDVSTVKGVQLAAVERHLLELVENGGDPGAPWQGRWWTAATAGTTGRRGVFVWGRREWQTIIASYARANDWAGVGVDLRRPLRVAVVSSLVPTHQSAVVGATLSSRLVPTLRLDAADPIRVNTARLDAFRPDVLVGYASSLRALAAEQQDGRLQISPKAVFSASEALSREAEATMDRAWGAPPFDVYAATETAGIASPCTNRTRHLYEDLLIAEPVDQADHPVPAGTVGAKLLVTVLFSRTLPLIRYEISDRVAVGARGCPCGRAFSAVTQIEGRAEDVLDFSGSGDAVSVHPIVFHNALDPLAPAGWQIVQEPGQLRLLVVAEEGEVTPAAGAAVEAALRRAGVANVPVVVEQIPALRRTPLGKAPLITRRVEPR
ncbi:MAG TPA: phenylacetate--CoA ligase family protein [Dermatophilaceae bacterium]|nr:phenylacetate--CoA ligase family protein [Dermatophilaceae bacterium]